MNILNIIKKVTLRLDAVFHLMSRKFDKFAGVKETKIALLRGLFLMITITFFPVILISMLCGLYFAISGGVELITRLIELNALPPSLISYEYTVNCIVLFQQKIWLSDSAIYFSFDDIKFGWSMISIVWLYIALMKFWMTDSRPRVTKIAFKIFCKSEFKSN